MRARSQLYAYSVFIGDIRSLSHVLYGLVRCSRRYARSGCVCAHRVVFSTFIASDVVDGRPPAVSGLYTVNQTLLSGDAFLVCLGGLLLRLLAKKGILDKKTQKQLNRVNVSLFTPCLLFSKVAFSLSPAKLRELWIIPIFFVVVTAISAVVASILGVVLRLRRSQRNFAMAAAMFNNSNSLPIALM